MAEKTHEFTGKTVDEAVAEALSTLKVPRSDVAVEVLSRGSRGIFGIGSEPARVRITLEPEHKSALQEEQETPIAESPAADAPPAASDVAPAPAADVPGRDTTQPVVAAAATAVDTGDEDAGAVDEPQASESVKDAAGKRDADGADLSDDELADVAAEMLGEIVRLMGFEAAVVASWREDDDNDGSTYLLLDIEGEDLGALIGRRGETLANLQYIVRLMVNQRIKQWRNIVVDVEKYKERREAQLNQLALRMADQVAESGRAQALEPMPANERRLVHIALRDHPLVYTQSSGEDDRRKVNIVPRDTASD